MTAEIAILNRSAVALAADSAVTLGIGNQHKIYNTTDKLFQLVLDRPVGIMIYGGAEYMGIPLETIVKEFRGSASAAPKPFLKDYATSFFEFLTSVSVPETYLKRNAFDIVFQRLSSLMGQAQSNYFQGFDEPVRRRKKKKNSPQAFWDYVGTKLVELARKDAAILNNKLDNPHATVEDGQFDDVIDEAIARTLINVEDEQRAPLKEWAYLTLRKDVFSSGHTGFVFAGFGDNERFPKLLAFQSDGKIGDGVKRRQSTYIDIDREGPTAHIEPFAQKEMVDRFLDGIDPDFERYVKSSLQEALDDMARELIAAIGPRSKAKQKAFLKQLPGMIEAYIEKFDEKAERQKTNEFRLKILDIVNFMPKSDLANMAESLINLTSTKRRVSAESETVGGPVDVAVISKHDGFVWIKRKHYFSADLNPRYFVGQQQKLTKGTQP